MDIDIEQYLRDMRPDELIGKPIAILGNTGSGKSNTSAVIMEEAMRGGVPICVVDIAGEYYGLKEQFPLVNVVGRSLKTLVDHPLTQTNVQDVAHTAYRNGSPIILDMSAYPKTARPELLQMFFYAIWDDAARLEYPLLIFLEEAHNWVPQGKKTAVSELFVDIAAEGRKRGLSLIMIGQRSTRIDKDTLTQADLAFLHKVRHPRDLAVYEGLIPRPRSQVHKLVNDLDRGQALVLRGDKTLRCTIRKRHTTHYGATPTMNGAPAQMSLWEALNKAKE